MRGSGGSSTVVVGSPNPFVDTDGGSRVVMCDSVPHHTDTRQSANGGDVARHNGGMPTSSIDELMLPYLDFQSLDPDGTEEGTVGALGRAISNLLSSDGMLFTMGAHERALAHRLAVHLGRQVEDDLDVDVELCRMRGKGTADEVQDFVNKRMERDGHARPDGRPGDVFPDIVVHRRGAGVNRLVVETKRWTGPGSLAGVDGDIAKLRLFAGHEFGYEMSVILFFDLTAVGRERARLFRLADN